MHIKNIVKERQEFIGNYTKLFGNPVQPDLEECQRHFNTHKNFPDTFGWVLNLKEQTVMDKYGVFNYLGYTNINFNNILTIVHPDYVNTYIRRGFLIYKIISDNIHIVEFAKHRFSCLIPLRKSNGNYMLVKQTSYPYRFDKDNNMVEQFNFFYVVSQKFKPERYNSFEFEIYFENIRSEELIKELSDKFKVLTINSKEYNFSARERELFKCFVYSDAEVLNDVAGIMGLKTDTVKSYSKNAFTKGKKLFPQGTFTNTRELALFLDEANLI